MNIQIRMVALLGMFLLAGCTGLGHTASGISRKVSSTTSNAFKAQSFAGTTDRKIWVHPNADNTLSDDWANIFDNSGNDFSQVIGQTNVYQMFQAAITHYSAAQLQNMTATLKAHNVAYAIESVGILPYACGGADSGGLASAKSYLNDVQPIYDAGGQVDYISLDQMGIQLTLTDSNRPDNNCNYSVNQGVAELIVFMQTIKSVHPETSFGLIAALPGLNYNGSGSYFGGAGGYNGNDFKDVLNVIVNGARGAGLDFEFLHVDNPYKYFTGHPGVSDVYAQRLMPLKGQVEGLGLRFGLLLMSDLGGGGNCDISDRADLSTQFVNENIADLNDFASHGGLTSADFITESWCHSPMKILNENTQDSFMFMANHLIYNYKQMLIQQGLSAPTANVISTSIAAPSVIGAFEKVSDAGMSGWACLPHNSASLNINVFVGGDNNSGNLIYSGVTASPSALALEQQCQASGAAYRFAISWPTGSRANFAGQTINVYATSPLDGSNVLLSGSGQFVIPAAPATSTPPVTPVTTVTLASNSSASTDPSSAVVASAPVALAAPVADPAAPAQIPLLTQTVYRYFNGNAGHLFALSPDGTGIPAGYTLEGAAFNVYMQNYANTMALYRCNNGHTQFLSTDPGCEGQTVRGLLGYIGSVPAAGRQPLYRVTNGNGDSIADMVYDIYTSIGYSLDGQLGFVP